jgi:hypothetical protein
VGLYGCILQTFVKEGFAHRLGISSKYVYNRVGRANVRVSMCARVAVASSVAVCIFCSSSLVASSSALLLVYRAELQY